jgi:hypothetical protein
VGLLPEPYAAIRFPGKGICVLPLGTRRQKGQHATVISSEVLRQSKKARSSGPQHHKARGPDTAASFLRTVLAQAHSSLAVLRTTCMPAFDGCQGHVCVCKAARYLLPPSLNVSISRVQNFAHNISIPMHKDKNKGVGGWVESWWIV